VLSARPARQRAGPERSGDGERERKYSAPALEKGLDILELLAERGTPLTLTQMADALRRSVGELFRMVDSLVYRGYVAQSESGDGFELTNKLFALGVTRAPARTLLEEALPVMRRLSRTIHQSCHLAVASGAQMVVIARIEAPGNEGYSVRVGYRRALIESASGLVLYAFQPESVRAEWRRRLSTGVSARTWRAFEARGAQARKLRYVRANSDVTRHIVDLSAPVMSRAGVVAALTCPYIETPSADSIRETVAAIRRQAGELSGRLSSEDAGVLP
jgi:DNA-binding IclR family transcriptional regulator